MNLDRTFKENLGLVAILLLAIILTASIHHVYQNHQAFRVTDIQYSMNASEGWFTPEFSGEGFRPANLPFFAGDGFFRIEFTSNKRFLDLVFYADDCVEQVYVEGIVLYSGDKCKSCSHCKTGLGVSFHLDKKDTHTLAVKTKDTGGGTYFFVEHQQNAFIWRILALLSSIMLLVLLFKKIVGKNIPQEILSLLRRLSKNRAIVVIMILSVIARLIIMPAGGSNDITGHAIIYTENLVHKRDFDFTKLDRDYQYGPSRYMNKPPGLLYLLALIRIVFGFTNVYNTYLLKFPALIGDLLVAYVIWSVLNRRLRDQRISILAASLYLFNPGVIAQTAYLGKPDSLGLGILMLAVKNIKRWKFPVYYSLSIVCKQFPLLFLPWLLFQKRMLKKMIIAAAITVLLVSPHLLHDHQLFIERLAEAHLGRHPQWLSWMINLDGWEVQDINEVTRTFMRAYIILLIFLAFTLKTDEFTAGALIFSSFILFSQIVFEHYILWAIPFLLVTYFLKNKISALIAFLMASLSCAIHHQYHSLLGDILVKQWSILLAVVLLFFCADVIRESFTLERIKRGVHRIKMLKRRVSR